ncbi:MAG: class I SAM-dependent methyltransferase [Verrucomicrobiota bacterium]
MAALYDSIGKGYIRTREADPRIASRLLDILDIAPASAVLDVGAGTGNYSYAIAEAGHRVTALEPSGVMREQGRVHPRLRWIEGSAERLPFEDNLFDGIVMTLCLHHFTDWKLALKEASRAVNSGPIVIFTYDAGANSKFWLHDYFPSFLSKDKEWFPRIAELRRFAEGNLSRSLQVCRFPLPRDLKDHFAAAGWARPEIYLDEGYRAGISSFSCADREGIEDGLQRLAIDLESGDWDSKYRRYRNAHSIDVGYVFLRITDGEQDVVADPEDRC